MCICCFFVFYWVNGGVDVCYFGVYFLIYVGKYFDLIYFYVDGFFFGVDGFYYVFCGYYDYCVWKDV